MRNYWKYLCYLALGLCLLAGVLHIFRADTWYETDIARDMLLLEEMVAERKISFIGGRSSIPGVFHGPLYYWFVLPFFALSAGNPVVVSYVWLALYWLFLAVFYLVAKRVFNEKLALMAATLLAGLTVFIAPGYTHAVLAIFLIVPIIYCAYRYMQENSVWWLVVLCFALGLLIQFQMAFGVPAVLLLGGWILVHIFKQKNLTHLLVWLVMLIPLSTFIVFDLRHDFIQVTSVLAFLGEKGVSGENHYWAGRLQSILEAFRLVYLPGEWLWKAASVATIGVLVWLGQKMLVSKQKQRTFLLLSLLIVFGFWLATAPFRDNIWPQYYRVLLPVIVLGFSYFLLNYLPKKWGEAILLLIIGVNTLGAVRSGLAYLNSQPTDDEVHWKFYRQMTSDIFADSQGQSFGYYVFSPDQYGYQGKYAIRYFARHAGASTTPYQKQALTYLVIAPNDRTNPWANEDFWQANQVKIDRSPDKEWSYPAGYQVRRFDLSEAEVATASDPTLLDGIHFR